MVLATSHGFAGSYLASRFGLSASAIAGDGTGMERDYEVESKVFRADLADPAEIGRKAGERAVRRLNPRQVADRPRHRRLRSARLARPRRPSRRRRQRRGDRPQDQLPPRQARHRRSSRPRSASPTIRRAGAGSPRAPSTARGSPARRSTSSTTACCKTWLLDSATGRELGLATNGRAARGGGNPSPGSTNLTLMPGEQSPEELIARDRQRPLRHRADRPRRQHHHRRLQPRRRRLRHRERRARPAGERDHHRRQPQRHVPRDRAGQRPRLPLRDQRADGRHRRHDHRRPLIGMTPSHYCATTGRMYGAAGAKTSDQPAS